MIDDWRDLLYTQSKPNVIVTDVVFGLAGPSGAASYCLIAPGTTPNITKSIKRTKNVLKVVILTPFHNVAMCIEQTVGIAGITLQPDGSGPVETPSLRQWLAVLIDSVWRIPVAICLRAVQSIAKVIRRMCPSATGVIPFEFRWQSILGAQPFAEDPCVKPMGAYHRKLIVD